MAWLFNKIPELRSQAARLGFSDPDGVAADLAAKHPADSIETGHAAALVRRHAAARPDLIAGDAWAKWSPAELRDVFMTLVRERRVREAQAFRERHAAQLDVAEGQARRADGERTAAKRTLESRLYGARHREEQANADVRRVTETLERMSGGLSGPGAGHHARVGSAEIQRLQTELALAQGEAEAARQAQTAITTELGALGGTK